ncbi:probable serine/threonine-protein kinase kinX [Diaphorina citri]|uniref:Probable serine/threonine-protein kinase kinX n=1 Tax=Diaphorina citri TaxID=121845 RepID=A0A3Q0ILF6_DIACI|nr:probable serine/threonine-protein kinase kinX [Diaphorina citri]
MNNNLNIIDSNFSDDQLDQTNFIPFATNLSENIDNRDQEQNTLNASDAIVVDNEFNAKMVSTTDVIDEKTKTSSVLDSSNVNEINIVTDVGMEDKTSSVSNDNSKEEIASTASDTIKVDMVVNNDILTENEILNKGIDDQNLSKDSENVDKHVGNKSTPADASKDNAITLDKKIEEIMNSSGLNGCDANQLEECNAGEGGIENKTTEENVPTGFKELMNKNIDSEIQESKDKACIQKESVSGDDDDDKTTDVIDEKTKTSSVLDSSNVNEINIVTDVGMEDKISSVSNDNSKGEITSTASDTIKVDMVVNNDILTENEILKKGIDDKNLSKDSENVDKDDGNKSTPAYASKDSATTLDKKIEEIMNSSGLNGCDANQPEESNAGEDGIENKTSEENVPTGFKELMTKNIDSEIQESKDKACIQKESVSGDDDDDKGDGTLYIDEGNDQEDGKSKDDADSETEKKTKDILDTTTEEEEEDEDEKAFGDNIKEKKKKLIKKAADIQAAEKIDIEAFKSEWSDEDDGNDDEEKSSNKGIKPGQGTKNIPAEVSSASKFPDVPIPEDIIDSSDKDTENIPNDTEVNPEDKPNKTSSEKHDKNAELSHNGKICADIIVGEAKENEASRETIKEASNVTQTPKFNEETISSASKAPITSKSETIDTSDNTVNTLDNAANTSGNTEKTESSLDENLEESMLIEEISQDGDTMEVEGQDGGALEVEQEAGEVVLEGGEHEEAIVVIGGSNGENLEDFVIVNENNEEQEIFEEIGEDGTKTYYVKVKPSTSAPEQDPSDKTETSETPVETEKETEPEEQAEETAVPVARRGRSPKSGSEVALFAKKTKGKKLRSNVPDEVARDLALQQLESPQLKRRAKRNTDPILVKPSAGPVLGPKVKTNLDDVAIKVVVPPSSVKKLKKSTDAQPPVDPTPTEPVPTTTPLIINTTTGGPTTKRAAKSSSATSSPRLVGSPRASGSRGGTKIIADQILLDVKGLKAKIPANTWNVTSEADDTEEETREGLEEVVVPTPSLKKLKKSTGKLSSPGQDEDKKRQKVMREINKLLGDEGAINMLYSVNQKRNRSGDSGGHPVMETARK